MIQTDRRVHKQEHIDKQIQIMLAAGWRRRGSFWRNPFTPKSSKRVYLLRDAIGICHLNGTIRSHGKAWAVTNDLYTLKKAA